MCILPLVDSYCSIGKANGYVSATTTLYLEGLSLTDTCKCLVNTPNNCSWPYHSVYFIEQKQTFEK